MGVEGGLLMSRTDEFVQGHSGYSFSSDDRGHLLSHPDGYIDYSHVERKGRPSRNEVWWVESHRKGMGTELVDRMMAAHPAEEIHWGDATDSGAALARKYRRAHPEVRGNLAGEVMS